MIQEKNLFVGIINSFEIHNAMNQPQDLNPSSNEQSGLKKLQNTDSPMYNKVLTLWARGRSRIWSKKIITTVFARWTSKKHELNGI